MNKVIDYEKLAKLGVYAFHITWKVLVSKQFEDDVFGERYHSGECTVGTEDDAYAVGRFLLEWCEKLSISNYEITIYEHLTRKWIHAWDSEKERVANPKHRVFISIGGTDCDGMSWRRYYSYRTLEEATKEVDEILSWADGPTNYCTLSVEDWEMGGYPEYRDRFAEAMGY